MCKVPEIGNRGSATVETALVMGIVLPVFVLVILFAFFLHDYTVAGSQGDYHIICGEEPYRNIVTVAVVEEKQYQNTGGKGSLRETLACRLPVLGKVSRTIEKTRTLNNVDNIRKIKVIKDGIQ